jgi:hypothetical protein
MTLADYIPSPAEIAARRARLGFAPAARPIARFKLVEPEPVPDPEPEPQPEPEPVAPLVVDVQADQIAEYTPKTVAMAMHRIAEIAAQHGLTLADITGSCRRVKFVKARHEAIIAIAVEFEKFSLPRIGQLFGDRDHTTILYVICKHVIDTGETTRGWSKDDALERIRRKCAVSGVSILHFEKVWKFRAGASA